MRSKTEMLLIGCLTLMGVAAFRAPSASAQTCESASDCDDGDECTQDRCIDGACVFPNRPFGSPCSDDGNECTRDACFPGENGLTCQHQGVSFGSPCSDDGNECTRDSCFPGENGVIACQHQPLPFGNPCNDEGNDCTRDSCFPGENGVVACQHQPLPFGSSCADDGNDCTFDSCFPGESGAVACQHQPLPFGSSCTDDGNDCTLDMCQPKIDSTGFECVHPSLSPGSACNDHSPCTPFDLCSFEGKCVGSGIPTDCRGASKSSLVIKDNERDDKDLVSYEWRKGQAIDLSELGDPTATTDYTLCVFDGAGMLQLSAGVLAGGLCNGSECWEAKAKGFAYKDDRGLSNGIGKIRLNAGALEKSSVQVRGKGADLPLPALPLTQPVQVQLINDETGVCIGSFFNGAIRNTEKKYIAESP